MPPARGEEEQHNQREFVEDGDSDSDYIPPYEADQPRNVQRVARGGMDEEMARHII